MKKTIILVLIIVFAGAGVWYAGMWWRYGGVPKACGIGVGGLLGIGTCPAGFTCRGSNPPIPDAGGVCIRSNGVPTSTPVSGQTYRSSQYGFSIVLSDSWKGYTVLNSQWQGWNIITGEVVTSGPIITLRHPLWTTANPREDMPVMVFTPDQWALVQQDKISLGAAPIPPSLLGQNSKYIMALPARYNYDFKTGFEEVDQLVHTLRAFEPVK